VDPERFSNAWDEFFAAVRRARGRAARRLDQGALTLAQFQLRAAFEHEREMCVGEVALAGGVATPTATRMLASLERDGIVERHDSEVDRRSVRVRLTAKGRRRLARKRDEIAAKKRAIYESLSPSERRQAEAILGRLASAMEEL
jgi:DNA-binding MarR family transcriptional regulator